MPCLFIRTLCHTGSKNLRMTWFDNGLNDVLFENGLNDVLFDNGLPLPFLHRKKLSGGWSWTNGLLGPCLPFWCCVVCFYCPWFPLLWLCLPLGLYLALRIDLWVMTGCWLVSYSEAALHWLVGVHCHPPPAVPQDWWALMASAGSVECVG